jgi:6-phosphofructokinase 2
LGVLLNKDTVKIEEVEFAAKELINRGKCEIAVTKLGANEALVFGKEKAYSMKPPKVIVKIIDAGNSMIAGDSICIVKWRKPEKIITQ